MSCISFPSFPTTPKSFSTLGVLSCGFHHALHSFGTLSCGVCTRVWSNLLPRTEACAAPLSPHLRGLCGYHSCDVFRTLSLHGLYRPWTILAHDSRQQWSSSRPRTNMNNIVPSIAMTPHHTSIAWMT